VNSSDYAWLALGAGVVSYDLLCVEGQTLSEGADAAMLRHPWLVRAVAFALAGHVSNVVPVRYDAVHWMFVGLRRVSRC
jgi:hypothetical protein